MSIEIKIVQPKNKINIYKIEELWKSACTNAFGNKTCPRIGISDDFYRMKLEFISSNEEYEKNKSMLNTTDDYVLFDRNNYGSGIYLWFEDDNICMKASFPTTYSEILGLYNLVNVMCNEFGIKEFYRGSLGEFNLVDTSQLDWFIELGINDTLMMLDRMKKDMLEDNAFGGHISINGVVNPICITLDNLKSWGIDLPLEGNIENITTVMKNYEMFMNEIQQRDLFYSVFKLYQITEDENQVINGYISVAQDCDIILPINPKTEFYFGVNRFDTSTINKFYAMLSDSNGENVYIEYDEFLNKIDYKTKEKYDGTHFIIRLSAADIEKIIG